MKLRIFISYKRATKLDEPLAHTVYERFREHAEVFIDQQIRVGTEWAREIQDQLSRSEYLIVLLSRDSVQSEMVRGEIEMARALASEKGGGPKILPIRVAFRDRLQYPLNAYLDHIQWAMWESEADTARLLEEIQAVLDGDAPASKTSQADFVPATEPPAPTPLAQPRRLDPTQVDSPEGTIDPESAFYLERSFDEVARNAIQRKGVTITIKGPRQMGKSSLLIRTMAEAQKAGKRAVFLDFQLIENEALGNADQFHRRFCEWVTDELEMESRVDEFWSSPLGNSQRCLRYFSRYLLKELDQPLVLAMDEVERLFNSPFRSDFFSMLRSWHNNRATNPAWKNLDLVLVTSTEPYQLIQDLNQSPFNVGEVLNLEDFTFSQVQDLNERHGSPLHVIDTQRLMELLNGHPYLTRRALYLVATNRMNVADLFAHATEDRGPFGDHLRYHLFRIYDKPRLVEGLCSVIRRNTCDDESLFFRLRGAGLIRRAGTQVEPRCQLYAKFFNEHLRCS